jgi:lysozyme
MKWLAAIAISIVAAYLGSKAIKAANSLDDMPSQETSLLEDLTVTMTPSTYAPANVSTSSAQANTRAFLDMLAYSEGTSGPDGYSTLFGGGLCDNLDDHPRLFFSFTNKAGQQLKTSAAGRYQFLSRTWDSLAATLDLQDFGPESQDRAALELIRQRGATADVQAGRIVQACAKCAPIWASLPGAGYNQPERKISQLIAAYGANGGQLDATT